MIRIDTTQETWAVNPRTQCALRVGDQNWKALRRWNPEEWQNGAKNFLDIHDPDVHTNGAIVRVIDEGEKPA